MWGRPPYRLAVGLAVLLVLAACARGTPYVEVRAAVGADLATLDALFTSVARAYDAAHAARRITNAQYQPWRAFVLEYQQRIVPIVVRVTGARVREELQAVHPEILSLIADLRALQVRLDAVTGGGPRP